MRQGARRDTGPVEDLGGRYGIVELHLEFTRHLPLHQPVPRQRKGQVFQLPQFVAVFSNCHNLLLCFPIAAICCCVLP